MTNIVLASNNKKKIAELQTLLGAVSDGLVNVQSLRDIGFTDDIVEDGTTFEENSLIKAGTPARLGHIGIADDSGLEVDALNGAPGVHSARWCGHHGDDEANNVKLLAELAGVDRAARAARFVSAVCVCLPDGRHFTYMGTCPGWVDFAPKGTNGFGYDPIFVPDCTGTADGRRLPNTAGRSYAELEDWEKDAISHRGEALRVMQARLPEDLAQG